MQTIDGSFSQVLNRTYTTERKELNIPKDLRQNLLKRDVQKIEEIPLFMNYQGIGAEVTATEEIGIDISKLFSVFNVEDDYTASVSLFGDTEKYQSTPKVVSAGIRGTNLASTATTNLPALAVDRDFSTIAPAGSVPQTITTTITDAKYYIWVSVSDTNTYNDVLNYYRFLGGYGVKSSTADNASIILPSAPPGTYVRTRVTTTNNFDQGNQTRSAVREVLLFKYQNTTRLTATGLPISEAFEDTINFNYQSGADPYWYVLAPASTNLTATAKLSEKFRVPGFFVAGWYHTGSALSTGNVEIYNNDGSDNIITNQMAASDYYTPELLFLIPNFDNKGKVKNNIKIYLSNTSGGTSQLRIRDFIF
jgi:hypothetical protein